MKKPPKELSRIRERQRAHAKLRFQQRFDLTLNRDQMREIERKITSGQLILVERKTRTLRTYLIEVEGRLVAIGYNSRTKRVVTALPETYLESLPPETVLWAKLRLLPGEAANVMDLIERGKAEPLYRKNRFIAFHQVPYEGQLIQIGYHSAKKWLLPYEDQPGQLKHRNQEVHPAGFQPLDLPPTESESFRKQIREASSLFLWRHSSTVTFHEVQWAGRPLRVGYSNTRDTFYVYQEPPESMMELRSSLKLLDQPAAVRAAVVQMVKKGEAQMLTVLGEHNQAYRVDFHGDVYYFEFYGPEERIDPWRYRTGHK